jgi:hypothetical protein
MHLDSCFLSAIVYRFFRRNKLDMGHRTFVDAMRVTSLFFPYFCCAAVSGLCTTCIRANVRPCIFRASCAFLLSAAARLVALIRRLLILSLRKIVQYSNAVLIASYTLVTSGMLNFS